MEGYQCDNCGEFVGSPAVEVEFTTRNFGAGEPSLNGHKLHLCGQCDGDEVAYSGVNGYTVTLEGP